MKPTGNPNKSIALFDLKLAFKKALPPALILLLVLIVYSPGAFLNKSTTISQDYTYTDEGVLTTVQEETGGNFYFLSGSDAQSNVIYYFVLGVGIFAAVLQFRFLNSRVQTNMLLSCGLSRRRLCMNRCSASLLALSAAFILPLTLTLLINISRLGLHGYILAAYAFFLVSFFVTVLIGFTAGVFGVLLSGTLPEAVFGSASLLFIPSGVILFIQYSLDVFLKGYPNCYFSGESFFPSSDYFINILNAPFFWKTKWLNPLFLLYNPYSTDNYNYHNNLWTVYSRHSNGHFMSTPFDTVAPHILLFAAWGLLCVLLLLFAGRLLYRRKVEIGGFYRKSKPVAVLITVAVSLLAAGIGFSNAIYKITGGAEVSFFSLDKNDILYCLGMVLLLTVVSVVVCLLVWYRGRLRRKESLKLLPLSLLILVVPVCCLAGGFGYTSYVPDADSVDEIILDDPLGITPSLFSVEPNAGNNSYSYSTYQGFTKDSDKDAVLTLHRLLVTDTDRSVNLNYRRIVYKLKNGKIITRWYSACSAETLKQYAALFETKTVKDDITAQFCDKSQWITGQQYQSYLKSANYAGYTPFLEGTPYYVQNWLYLNNITVSLRANASTKNTDITAALTQKKYDELVRRIILGYTAMTSDEFYTPDTPPLGFVSVVYTDENDSTYLRELPVYQSMTSALAYLKELGVADALNGTKDIQSISLYKCTAPNWLYGSSGPDLTDAQNTAVLTNGADIAALTAELYPMYLAVDEDVCYAVVTYENGTASVFLVKNR